MPKMDVQAIDWRKMEEMEHMSVEQLDKLPIGAIQLDEKGTILRYNQTEGELSGRNPGKVVGRNFFTEVAPCTNVQEFAGRFQEGFAQKSLNAIFPYRFDFQMAPIDVWVRLFYSRNTDSAWVFVSRRDDESSD